MRASGNPSPREDCTKTDPSASAAGTSSVRPLHSTEESSPRLVHWFFSAVSSSPAP